MIEEIFLASSNPNKLKEINDIFQHSNIRFSSVASYNLSDPLETGLTFEENALIKAKYYSDKINKITLSDDSGFVIDDLNGYPGIFSAREANKKGSYQAVFDYIYKQLNLININPKFASAHFVCSLCLYLSNKEYYFFTGKISGHISSNPIGENGFAYDKIFIPQGYDKTFAQMDKSEKNTISHRFLALEKLEDFLVLFNGK